MEGSIISCKLGLEERRAISYETELEHSIPPCPAGPAVGVGETENLYLRVTGRP
jgi:hypothetical protein